MVRIFQFRLKNKTRIQGVSALCIGDKWKRK